MKSLPSALTSAPEDLGEAERAAIIARTRSAPTETVN